MYTNGGTMIMTAARTARNCQRVRRALRLCALIATRPSPLVPLIIPVPLTMPVPLTRPVPLTAPRPRPDPAPALGTRAGPCHERLPALGAFEQLLATRKRHAAP